MTKSGMLDFNTKRTINDLKMERTNYEHNVSKFKIY